MLPKILKDSDRQKFFNVIAKAELEHPVMTWTEFKAGGYIK